MTDLPVTAPLPLPDLERPAGPFTVGEDGRPELVGSRCHDCGLAAFPERAVCSGCGGDQLGRTPLGRLGTLYSFAAVHVSSTRPTPYTLGYVDLPTGPRVLARIDAPEEDLAVDMPVALVVTASTDWAFVPEVGA